MKADLVQQETDMQTDILYIVTIIDGKLKWKPTLDSAFEEGLAGLTGCHSIVVP